MPKIPITKLRALQFVALPFVAAALFVAGQSRAASPSPTAVLLHTPAGLQELGLPAHILCTNSTDGVLAAKCDSVLSGKGNPEIARFGQSAATCARVPVAEDQRKTKLLCEGRAKNIPREWVALDADLPLSAPAPMWIEVSDDLVIRRVVLLLEPLAAADSAAVSRAFVQATTCRLSDAILLRQAATGAVLMEIQIDPPGAKAESDFVGPPEPPSAHTFLTLVEEPLTCQTGYSLPFELVAP